MILRAFDPENIFSDDGTQVLDVANEGDARGVEPGRALQGNGTNQYVSFPAGDCLPNGTDQWVWSAWVNRLDDPYAYNPIWVRGNAGSMCTVEFRNAGGTPSIRFSNYDGSLSHDTESLTGLINRTDWFHIAYHLSDDGSGQFYLNKVAIGSATADMNFTPTVSSVHNLLTNSGSYNDSTFSDIRICRGFDDDIADILDQLYSGEETGYEVFWPDTEASVGQYVIDKCNPDGGHGTIQNYSSDIWIEDSMNVKKSWANDVGYTLADGTQYLESSATTLIPVGCRIPRDPNNPTKCCAFLSNGSQAPLQYAGIVPKPFWLKSSHKSVLNGTNQEWLGDDSSDFAVTTESFEISGWVEPDDVTDGYGGFLGRPSSPDNTWNWAIYKNNGDGRVVFSHRPVAQGVVKGWISDSVILSDATSTYLRLVWDRTGGTVTLYAGNDEDNTIEYSMTAFGGGTVEDLTDNGEDLVVGRVTTGDRFAGKIWGWKFTKNGTLMGDWAFNEGVGDVALDGSGRGNHLTMQNPGSHWGTQDNLHRHMTDGFGRWSMLTSNTGGWGNAGGHASANPLAGDFEIDMLIVEPEVLFGVSAAHEDHDYNTIDWGIDIGGSLTFKVFENGGSHYSGPVISIGDRVRIARSGSTIRYYHIPYSTGIASLEYTSLVTSSATLYPEAAIAAVGDIAAFRLSNNGTIEHINWTIRTGVDVGIFRIPRDESDPTNDIFGDPLTDLPGFNQAETKIQAPDCPAIQYAALRDPGDGSMLELGYDDIVDNYSNEDTFMTDVSEDNHVNLCLFKEALTGGDLTTVEGLLNHA